MLLSVIRIYAISRYLTRLAHNCVRATNEVMFINKIKF